jgi:hypothetical protein
MIGPSDHPDRLAPPEYDHHEQLVANATSVTVTTETVVQFDTPTPLGQTLHSNATYWFDEAADTARAVETGIFNETVSTYTNTTTTVVRTVSQPSAPPVIDRSNEPYTGTIQPLRPSDVPVLTADDAVYQNASFTYSYSTTLRNASADVYVSDDSELTELLSSQAPSSSTVTGATASIYRSDTGLLTRFMFEFQFEGEGAAPDGVATVTYDVFALNDTAVRAPPWVTET